MGVESGKRRGRLQVSWAVYLEGGLKACARVSGRLEETPSGTTVLGAHDRWAKEWGRRVK